MVIRLFAFTDNPHKTISQLVQRFGAANQGDCLHSATLDPEHPRFKFTTREKQEVDVIAGRRDRKAIDSRVFEAAIADVTDRDVMGLISATPGDDIFATLQVGKFLSEAAVEDACTRAKGVALATNRADPATPHGHSTLLGSSWDQPFNKCSSVVLKQGWEENICTFVDKLLTMEKKLG